jgi:hypothetical protein
MKSAGDNYISGRLNSKGPNAADGWAVQVESS